MRNSTAPDILPRLPQKLLRRLYKDPGLIVVHPVARLRHAKQPMPGDRANASFFPGIGSPAVGTPEQKNRTPDLAPDFLRFLLVKAVRGNRAHKIIKLPCERSVGIPV